MKKKILTLGLVAALSATAAIGGTLAYFTDTADATNTFTVGNVEIELTEPKWTEAVKNTDGKMENVYPGQILDKDPTVTNNGKNPCFVRVSVSNLDQFGTEGTIAYLTGDEKDKLGADWVKEGNYFYYTKELAASEATSPLFEKIEIPTGLTNGKEDSYNKAAKDIVVNAEAVQSQGFTGTITADSLEGWFDTCMSKPATN